jgi:hypothetical protein
LFFSLPSTHTSLVVFKKSEGEVGSLWGRVREKR